MERYPVFIDQKINIVKMIILQKNNLQIQCNPNLNVHNIFHVKKILQLICNQKDQANQSNLELKEIIIEVLLFQNSRYIVQLQ